MQRPPIGICLGCVVDRCGDGDRVEIRLSGSFHTWTIRLIDCWVSKPDEPGGKESRLFLEHYAKRLHNVHLFIPAERPVEHLVRLLARKEVPGYIFISETQTLNEVMVETGHAYRTEEELQDAIEEAQA